MYGRSNRKSSESPHLSPSHYSREINIGLSQYCFFLFYIVAYLSFYFILHVFAKNSQDFTPVFFLSSIFLCFIDFLNIIKKSSFDAIKYFMTLDQIILSFRKAYRMKIHSQFIGYIKVKNNYFRHKRNKFLYFGSFSLPYLIQFETRCLKVGIEWVNSYCLTIQLVLKQYS